MSDIKRSDPPDQKTSHISCDSQEKDDNVSIPESPRLNTAILMTAYWLAWLATIIADLLISIERHIWEGKMFSESRLVDYIFVNHVYRWPYGGFYILDNFFRAWGPTISATFEISFAICTVLQITLARRLQSFKNNVSDVLVRLWMTFCIIAASYARFTPNEGAIIALPFAWLSAKTVQLVFLKKGVYPTEISEEKVRISQILSTGLFFVFYVRVLGVNFDIIAILLLCETGGMIWRWRRARSVEKQDIEVSPCTETVDNVV